MWTHGTKCWPQKRKHKSSFGRSDIDKSLHRYLIPYPVESSLADNPTNGPKVAQESNNIGDGPVSIYDPNAGRRLKTRSQEAERLFEIAARYFGIIGAPGEFVKLESRFIEGSDVDTLVIPQVSLNSPEETCD